MVYSYYLTANPFIIPEDFSPDYFKLSYLFPSSPEETGITRRANPRTTLLLFPHRGLQGQKETEAQKGPRTSDPEQTSTRILLVEENKDSPTREFTLNLIPPPTPGRRRRKKNAERL